MSPVLAILRMGRVQTPSNAPHPRILVMVVPALVMRRPERVHTPKLQALVGTLTAIAAGLNTMIAAATRMLAPEQKRAGVRLAAQIALPIQPRLAALVMAMAAQVLV